MLGSGPAAGRGSGVYVRRLKIKFPELIDDMRKNLKGGFEKKVLRPL
jgi:hypothetical protein